MSTIALYASQINQMSGMFKDVQTVVTEYAEALTVLQWKASTINKSACELEGVISNIKASTSTQVDKVEALGTFATESEAFVDEAVRIDGDAKDIINERKNDFYEEYEYLRPECEKPEKKWYEKAGDAICSGLKKAGEWCKEHWKEIVMTIVIIIGVVIAVVAVVYSGGTALVPILTALFTAFGASAGAATTAAVVISFSVAVIAVVSSVSSGVLNIIDTWCDMSKNTTFKRWQKGLNITSAISNGLYSIGAIYNAAHGISNQGLREFSKIVRGKNSYIGQIKPQANQSVFWSSLGKNGQNIARETAESMGKETMEMVMDRVGVSMPAWSETSKGAWQSASAAYAWNTSGAATAVLGPNVAQGTIWRSIEYSLLKMNPNVTGIFTTSGNSINYFSMPSMLSGLGSALESLFNLGND